MGGGASGETCLLTQGAMFSHIGDCCGCVEYGGSGDGPFSRYSPEGGGGGGGAKIDKIALKTTAMGMAFPGMWCLSRGVVSTNFPSGSIHTNTCILHFSRLRSAKSKFHSV